MASNIAYIFIAFPKITETFILREVLELQNNGLHIELFSLIKPRTDGVIHPEAKDLNSRTHYSPWILSWNLVLSHIYYIIHSPARYLHILLKVFCNSIRQPIELAKNIAIFPKCVHFTFIAQKNNIIHIHATFASHTATCAMIMAELSGIKYSVATHSYDIIYEKSLLYQRLLNASFLVTVSHYNLELIRKRYGEKVSSRTYIIRCGVNTDFYQTRKLPSCSKVDKKFNILCIAALRSVKGHSFLLNAVALLKNKGHNIKCILVGDGHLRNKLFRQVHKLKILDIVEMVGNQTQDEVFLWLQKADCVVLTSLREGIPVSLMEAMACGIPVVTTNSSKSISELVKDHVNGIIVPTGNEDAIASALSFLIENPSVARKFGESGREKIERDYNLVKNVHSLYKLFLKKIEIKNI